VLLCFTDAPRLHAVQHSYIPVFALFTCAFLRLGLVHQKHRRVPASHRPPIRRSSAPCVLSRRISRYLPYTLPAMPRILCRLRTLYRKKVGEGGSVKSQPAAGPLGFRCAGSISARRARVAWCGPLSRGRCRVAGRPSCGRTGLVRGTVRRR
jgi:hypothetical protein